MAYKVFLGSNFEPTSREAATLIKAVSDDGRVKFYHPKRDDKANTMKALYENAWGNVAPLTETELDDYARVTAADISNIEAELNGNMVAFLNADKVNG